MQDMLNQLGVLMIVVGCNILCGTYYNVNVKNIDFDWYKLFNGVLKAMIITAIAVGMSFAFQRMPDLVDAIGVTPNVIINSAIVLYTGKTLVGLGNILGVKVDIK